MQPQLQPLPPQARPSTAVIVFKTVEVNANRNRTVLRPIHPKPTQISENEKNKEQAQRKKRGPYRKTLEAMQQQQQQQHQQLLRVDRGGRKRLSAAAVALEATSTLGPLPPFHPILKTKMTATAIYDEYNRFVDHCSDPRARRTLSSPLSKQMSERRKVLNEVRYLSKTTNITVREALRHFDLLYVTSSEVKSTNTLVKYCASLKSSRGTERHTPHQAIKKLFETDLDQVYDGPLDVDEATEGGSSKEDKGAEDDEEEEGQENQGAKDDEEGEEKADKENERSKNEENDDEGRHEDGGDEIEEEYDDDDSEDSFVDAE
ncbi:hypothetical protein BGZ83_009870 [Gryganskiella cystojenkinii]|nr:hypothetical protein BGZ83_009870 [Gryganskiella cystojenkinii]